SNAITVVVDTTAPASGTLSFSNLTDTGSINAPPVTTDNAFDLTLSGQEAGASVAYQVSLNGGTFTATSANQSGLADASYHFRALVTDAAGNSATSTAIAVAADTTPPASGTLSDRKRVEKGSSDAPPGSSAN